ncbi:MAG: extracellular solute-binding protein [Chloroflexi bacterium]|nr:extracellular solute-binding protein [Chloroflexota bacterium]
MTVRKTPGRMLRHKRLSRRDFLRTAGAALGALSISRTLSLRPAAHAQARRQVDGVRVLVLANPYGVMLEHVIEQFTAQTGIAVNLEILSGVELLDRVFNPDAVDAAGADVFTVDQPWLGEFVENDRLLPLDDFVRADGDVALDDFIPQVLHSLCTYRGQLWTLPIDTYCEGVMYRTDLFEALGLAAPPADPDGARDWTWTRYLDTVQQLHGVELGDTSFFGTVVCGAHRGGTRAVLDMYAPFAMLHGARWFASFPDTLPWNFNPTTTSDANLTALQRYLDLFNYAPPESLDYSHLDAGIRFGAGDVGMFYWYSVFFAMLKDRSYFTGEPSVVRDVYDVGLMPVLEEGDSQPNTVVGLAFGISPDSLRQDEAWQFIKWATGFEGQKAMGMVPDYGYQFANFARRSLFLDSDLREHYPYLDLHLALLEAGTGNKHARPAVPIYQELGDIYGTALRQAVKGIIMAEEALDAADIQFRNALVAADLLPFTGTGYADTFDNTLALIASLTT